MVARWTLLDLVHTASWSLALASHLWPLLNRSCASVLKASMAKIGTGPVIKSVSIHDLNSCWDNNMRKGGCQRLGIEHWNPAWKCQRKAALYLLNQYVYYNSLTYLYKIVTKTLIGASLTACCYTEPGLPVLFTQHPIKTTLLNSLPVTFNTTSHTVFF